MLRSVSAMEDGEPLCAFQGLRQRAGKSRLGPAGRPGDQHPVSGVDPVARRQAHHGLAVDAAAGASAPRHQWLLAKIDTTAKMHTGAQVRDVAQGHANSATHSCTLGERISTNRRRFLQLRGKTA